MNIKEAAARLGVTRNTIYNFARAGKLRLLKRDWGHQRYSVPVEDVERLLNARPIVIGGPLPKSK